MRRAGILVALSGTALLVALGALRSSPASAPVRKTAEVDPPAPPERAVEPGPDVAARVKEAEAELLGLCEERDRLLKRARELRGSAAPPGDEPYRRAERHYQSGDLVRAIAECEEALKRQPGHAAARALLLESQFVLREGGVRPAAPSDPLAAQRSVAADEALLRGARHFSRGELDAAEREYLLVLEHAASDRHLHVYREAARKQLDRIRAARK